MSPADYAAILGVWIVGVIAPGPDVVLVLRESARLGRAHGTAAAFGVVLGIAVWIVLAIAGAEVLLNADDRVVGSLEVLGGGYLVYLGIGALRAARAASGPSAFSDLGGAGDAPAGPIAASLRRGILTNLSNPKALVFFGTVFSVLVPPDASTADRGAVFLLLTGIAAFWFVGLARVASSARVRTTLGRRAALLDGLAGVAFSALGAISVAAGLSTLAG